MKLETARVLAAGDPVSLDEYRRAIDATDPRPLTRILITVLGAPPVEAVPVRAGCLTGGQLEVLSLTADGMTSDQIGRKLSISCEAVRSRHREIKKRLRARTAAHAVALGFRGGLIG